MIYTKSITKQKVETLSRLIGQTPLIPIERLHDNPDVRIFAKAEWMQLGGSVKARAAYNIIRHAILSGRLDQNRQLLDASSGNTGIAYAAICARLDIPVKIILPENTSPKRKEILRTLGAELEFSSPFESTDGAQRYAQELVNREPDRYFYADQYANDNNWKAHYYGTAEEIINQTGGKITHFVAGLGTTGTFTGISRRLKSYNKFIHTIAFQPDSPLHGLEGWKHLETAIVPSFFDPSLVDHYEYISSEKAIAYKNEIAKKEGLMLSPSAAANLYGAVQLASELHDGIIVTILPDNGDKYE